MNVGIAGLGLIGGSLSKAFKRAGGHSVFGFDIDSKTTEFAIIAGALDGKLDERAIGMCDCLLIALYPKAACEYLERISPFIKKDALVLDCCGTKRAICDKGFALAEKYGFVFVGGHPMAGTHHSGFKSSRADLFDGAGMVIVPPVFDDISLLSRIKKVLEPMKFASISAITAKKHDEVIAFTSQLAHIVSNAYVKSPTAPNHKGFSAGSFKDLTRVAQLNPAMWTELFAENRDNLIKEIDILTANLIKYREVLAEQNYEGLYTLLDEGSKTKERVERQ
ncbi:MAG: prephenate dehydrogenase [Firmicutes bacterium ADurb.Bin300]|jgi:prephenate dehydrogenase|nr:MAG: prephenate dehydrogenase [Firmicutes bacterium ADurb.Bin300]